MRNYLSQRFWYSDEIAFENVPLMFNMHDLLLVYIGEESEWQNDDGRSAACNDEIEGI